MRTMASLKGQRIVCGILTDSGAECDLQKGTISLKSLLTRCPSVVSRNVENCAAGRCPCALDRKVKEFPSYINNHEINIQSERGDSREGFHVPVWAGKKRPFFSRRAKARKCGLSGNYWYPIELDCNIKSSQIRAVVFWKTSICLWRGANGNLFAIEDRCAHRQLRISTGHVEGNNVTCCYHGWVYNGSGKVVKIHHEIPESFKSFPHICVRSYPVRVKYGLIFVFPGDPCLSEIVELPSIPWLDTEDPVPFKHALIEMNAHFSLIVENQCDFYHAYLHRKLKPFTFPVFKYVQRNDETIIVKYKTDMGQSFLAKYFQGDVLTNMSLWYDYPMQRSNLEDKFLHWCFFLPIHERLTKVFFIFLWGPISVLGIRLPYCLRPPLMSLAFKFYLIPLLSEDKYAMEEEQSAHIMHYDKNAVELNPIVSSFQQLTIEKWDEYLESEYRRKCSLNRRHWKIVHGAGLTDYEWATYE